MLSEEWDGGFLEGWEQEMTETGLGGLHGSQLSDKGGCNHELTHSKQPQVLLLQEALCD